MTRGRSAAGTPESDELKTEGRPGRGMLLASRPRVRALVAGLLFAGLSALAFDVHGMWWAAFLAPVPVMALGVRPIIKPGRAGMYAALGVTPWWALAHIWTYSVSAAGIYPLVLVLSAYTWVYVWVAGRVSGRFGVRAGVMLAPVVWMGVEFLRGSVAFHGYGFYLTGHPLIESPGAALAAPAAWLGAYFVSFLAAMVAGGVAGALVRGRRGIPGLIGAVALAGAVFAVAAATAAGGNESGARVRFAVVQSNIAQDNKMAWTFRQRVRDFLVMRDLTGEAATYSPDVIVWPEGMFPGRALDRVSLATERDSPAAWPMEMLDAEDAPDLTGVADYIGASSLADELLAAQRAIGVPIVVGATGYDGLRVVRDGDRLRYEWDEMYNSVLVLEGGEADAVRYDKVHLAPFGEVMPYISAWPWLERQMLAVGANGMSFVLSAGKQERVLEAETAAGEVRMATPICFEGTVPSVCRKLVYEHGRRRAGVLVNLTNDGWFGGWTLGREHHALTSRWRCVELGTAMVRAANTGISAAYDARGRVISDEVRTPGGIAAGRDNVAGVVVAEVALGTGRTLYALVGDAFGWGCLGATALGMAWTFVGGGNRRRAGERADEP